MKKNILIIISILFFATSTNFAQDLIVTTSGDSIKCSIYELKDNFVYFKYFNQNHEITTSLLKLNQVVQIKRNIYHAPANKELTRKKINSFDPIVHIGFSGGLSHYLGYKGNTEDSESSFFKKISKSKNFNFEGCIYIPNTGIGLGIFHNHFTTSYQNKTEFVEFWTGKKYTTISNQQVDLNFTGPALFIKGAHKKTTTNFMFSPGALKYNKINASRLAFATSFSIETLPIRFIGIGLKSNFIYGNSEPFPYKSGGENLSHFDLAALFSIYL